MKTTYIVLGLVVLFLIGAYFLWGDTMNDGMKNEMSEEMNDGEVSMEGDMMDDNTNGTEVSVSGEVGVAPASNPQALTKVEAALAREGSQRCEWVGETGQTGFALIKNGKVRVENDRAEGGSLITLHTSAASYIWVSGETTGTIVAQDMQANETVVEYQTRSQIADFLRTNNRVKCSDSTLSDTHFEVPKGVEFTKI